MNVSVLGIDLGKTICSIVGLNASGAVILRRRAKRETLIGLAAIDEDASGRLWHRLICFRRERLLKTPRFFAAWIAPTFCFLLPTQQPG
jgi:hypothetical protein